VFVVCVLILAWSQVVCTVLQAHSYSTGILVRSIEPDVRRRLVERLEVAAVTRGTGKTVLKEFLKMSETAADEQTLLASLKGGGCVVVPNLTSRNSVRRFLPQAVSHGLRRAAFSHFYAHQEFRYQVKLGKNTNVVTTHLKINGKKWDIGALVSFIYGGRGTAYARATYRLGFVMEYIVVKFWPANEGGDTEALDGRVTTFLKLWPLAESGVMAIYGNGDGFTSFRVEGTSGLNQEPIYIHSDALSTLYCNVPDAALNKDYR
jgi:hypothetical protein